MAKLPEQEPNNVNRISSGTEITGNIKTNSDIRIDGILEGNLETLGKLVVGSTGKIKGEIKCKNFDIEGEVTGKIKVKELLSLKRTSKINGDILTNKLSIEPGALFTGKCNMSSDNEPKQPEEPKKAEKSDK
ncbi:MAG: polymer-forming cytoskeletal protein [Bacteroidales bacterium]|nr:polymer-forming cytoskeletal protein [Bacteroidales bacterium]